MDTCLGQPRAQGLLLDDFQNGGSSGEDLLPTIRHFENRRGEGPGDEVDVSVNLLAGVWPKCCATPSSSSSSCVRAHEQYR